jgi:uncharacterized membrane protein
MNGPHRPWVVLLALAAVAGLLFTGTSTYDFAQYLDRQVHGLHCSFLPGLGSVDVTGASGCHVTLMSPYSSVLRKVLWGGIPVSLAGMGTFALLLFRALSHLFRARPDRSALQADLLLALVPVGASLVMGTIALRVLDAACKLCIGTYIASTVALVAALGAWWSMRSPIVDLEDEDGDAADEPSDEAAPRAGAGAALLTAVGQLAVFNLAPIALWAMLSPAHGEYIGTCGSLVDASDRYDVLIPISGQGTPAVEVLDPLCPSCRGFEERLSASGQGEQLARQLLLFPLDSTCNWMVTTSLHPGACTVSEAMLCADGRASEVLAWAFAHQEEIRTATAADPEAAGRMVLAAFPDLEGCLGGAPVKSRLNQSLRWAVKNQLPVLTPQLFVNGQRVCDADTDLGLDYTLAHMLTPSGEGAQ